MVSQRKLTANRLNSKKSTGPKTKAGKEASSQNATTHGFFCNSLLLPHDNPTIFHTFRDSYLLALKPQNLPELQLVDQIVSAVWRLRRLQEAESLLHSNARQDTAQHYRCANDTDSEEVSLLGSCHAYNDDQIEAKLSRLSRHEQRYQRTIHRCYHELRQLRKDHCDKLDPCPYFDHPEKVFHLNPNDIPPDPSTWKDVKVYEDQTVGATLVSPSSPPPTPSISDKPQTTNHQPDQNKATDPSPIENQNSKIKNPSPSSPPCLRASVPSSLSPSIDQNKATAPASPIPNPKSAIQNPPSPTTPPPADNRLTSPPARPGDNDPPETSP